MQREITYLLLLMLLVAACKKKAEPELIPEDIGMVKLIEHPRTTTEKKHQQGLAYEVKGDWQKANEYFKAQYHPEVVDVFVDYHLGLSYWNLAKTTQNEQKRAELFCKSRWYLAPLSWYCEDFCYPRPIIIDGEISNLKGEETYDAAELGKMASWVEQNYQNNRCDQFLTEESKQVEQAEAKIRQEMKDSFHSSPFCAAFECQSNFQETLDKLGEKKPGEIWSAFLKFAVNKNQKFSILTSQKFDEFIEFDEDDWGIMISSPVDHSNCTNSTKNITESEFGAITKEYFGIEMGFVCD